MIDISIKEDIVIRDKNIVVIGLGISGFEVSKLANHLGAKVFVSDSGSTKIINSHAMELMSVHHIACETGIHSPKIYKTDMWIVSPGISKNSKIIIKARNLGIPIVSEIEFSSWFTSRPIIAVTGSNGKTTTCNLLHQMCQSIEVHSTMAGNMGIPFSKQVLNDLLKPDKNQVYILEISSFQMEFIYHFSPDIAIYTNLSIDHLDRHGSKTEYYNMKLQMSKHMNIENHIIYNGDDLELIEILKNSKSKLVPFSIQRSDTLYKVDSGKILNGENQPILNINEISIPGEHNLSNMISAATCSHLFGIKDDKISQVMKKYSGIEHRLEYVSVLKDIEFYNDSKATNIDSVIVAIKSFTKPIVLILGGKDKGADFRLLLPHIKPNHVREIISYGEAGGQINTALGDAVRSVQVSDLSSAVKKAQYLAAPGDIVLLSPGCASFDEFSNFEERGNLFKSLILGTTKV